MSASSLLPLIHFPSTNAVLITLQISQPRKAYNDTYAGTSNTTNCAFLLQAYIADATHRGCLDQLCIGDFYFPCAFKLTRHMTNGHQLIAKPSSDLPSPRAGQLAEITGCCYGI